jgi:hypothetical protein
MIEPIAELKPDPKNPRTHSPRQIGQIARSIWMVERAGFELTGDFCSRSVRHMNTSNRRCQQDIMDISWKAFAKRFVSSAIPKAAM